MKLKDILNINQILKMIIDNSELNIDVLLKFKLLGIMKNIEVPINNFETIRNDKIREYGKETEDENGNKTIGIDINDKECMKKFSDDLNKILDSDVEINIQKLKPSDIFDKGLPSEYLVGLYSIIEE